MLRIPTTACVLSAALIGAALLACPAVAAPTIGTATVSPANLPATGGKVTVTVKVTGSGFTRVWVNVSLPGTRTYGAAVLLSGIGGGKYRGAVTVSPNTQKKSQISYLMIQVTNAQNKVVKTKQTGQVKLAAASSGTGGGSGAGGGDELPPPPPRR
jgi:hypothetical protein